MYVDCTVQPFPSFAMSVYEFGLRPVIDEVVPVPEPEGSQAKVYEGEPGVPPDMVATIEPLFRPLQRTLVTVLLTVIEPACGIATELLLTHPFPSLEEIE